MAITHIRSQQALRPVGKAWLLGFPQPSLFRIRQQSTVPQAAAANPVTAAPATAPGAAGAWPLALTKISDLSAAMIDGLLVKATEMKRNRHYAQNDLRGRTLLMLFEKPSLRTRVSFETGMTQMGGHAIFYSIQDSPLGEKETVTDTAKTLSRYVDAITARVMRRQTVAELAQHATVPVINALDDFAHPCQMLADMLTLRERFGWPFKGLRMAYLGDTRNNVTYDLMRTAAVLGFDLNVAGPQGSAYDIEAEVLAECASLSQASGASIRRFHDPAAAVQGVHVVYTDSWMSYGIPSAAKAERQRHLLPFQVTTSLMALAAPNGIFMNCLPAMRGLEQEAAVIDGPKSVVFDQAENRLHAQKALLHTLLAADRA